MLAVVMIAGGGRSGAAAEERTFQGVSSWEARARVYVTGPQQAFLLGAFAGRLAVEKEPSPLDGAQIVCPTAIDADYAAITLRGEGRCVMTTGTGERLFARWTCVGAPDKGCVGRFVLTGGTGAYQGVTGEGDLVLRLVLADLVQFDRFETDYDLKGLATWPGMRYRTP